MQKITMAIWGGIGAFIAISILVVFNQLTSEAVWLMAPFGATAVLVFGVPSSPLAQPKNVIFGHVITAVVGLLFVTLGMNELWMMALATGIGVFLMLLTNTTHPPAGANPLLIMMTQQGWPFLFFPVLAGAVTIVIVGYYFNYFRTKHSLKIEQVFTISSNTLKDKL